MSHAQRGSHAFGVVFSAVHDMAAVLALVYSGYLRRDGNANSGYHHLLDLKCLGRSVWLAAVGRSCRCLRPSDLLDPDNFASDVEPSLAASVARFSWPGEPQFAAHHKITF
jgi:hypothetical protein